MTNTYRTLLIPELIFLLSLSFCSSRAQQATATEIINALMLNGKYEKALVLLNGQIKQDSLKPDPYYKAGLIYQEFHRHDKAIAMLSRAAAMDTNNSSYHFALGKSYALLGHDAKAVRLYRLAYTKDSNNMNAAYALLNSLGTSGYYSEAQALARKMLENDSTNSYLYSQLAFCSMRSDSFAQAMKYYEKALSLNQSDINSLQQLIILCIKFNRMNMADSLISYGLKEYNDIPGFYRLKAEVLYKAGNYELAAENYMHCAALGDSSANVMYKLGMSYYNYGLNNSRLSYNDRVKYYTMSRDALMSSFRADSQNPLVCHYIGIMNSRIGEYAQALEYFSIASQMSIAGFAPEIYYYIGECSRISKNYTDAVYAYKKSLALDPNSTTALASLNFISDIYQQLNDKASLYIFYRELLNSHSNIREDISEIVSGRMKMVQKYSGSVK